MIGWPEDPKLHPHPFAKLLRHCVSALSYVSRRSKEAIRRIDEWVRQTILLSLVTFVKRVYKLTMTAFREARFHVPLVAPTLDALTLASFKFAHAGILTLDSIIILLKDLLTYWDAFGRSIKSGRSRGELHRLT